jgi:hypothetical protein
MCPPGAESSGRQRAYSLRRSMRFRCAVDLCRSAGRLTCHVSRIDGAPQPGQGDAALRMRGRQLARESETIALSSGCRTLDPRTESGADAQSRSLAAKANSQDRPYRLKSQVASDGASFVESVESVESAFGRHRRKPRLAMELRGSSAPPPPLRTPVCPLHANADTHCDT